MNITFLFVEKICFKKNIIPGQNATFKQMRKLLPFLSLLILNQYTGKTQIVIPLFDTIPNSKPSQNQEISVVKNDILQISHVSIPTLTLYMPENVKPGTTAIIICPGGGYSFLAAGHEGQHVAKKFNEWGIVAFVLKYRLPDDSIMFDKSIAPLQDALRAIQLVRQNATKWNIDPEKIGIMGFSAGGHLASTVATHFNKPVIANPDNISLRPDFSILIYPVISFTDSLTHKGSRNILIGKNPADELKKEFSNEMQVSSQTPKAFLIHSENDLTVPVGNSIVYYRALLKNNIPVELHVYEKGGHGFGMNNRTTEDQWMERLRNWLEIHNFL